MTDRITDLIIKTKVQQPPLKQGVVLRQHLLTRLNQSLSKRLTLISAPAGFGKTTLVISWLKQLNLPTAWLSLDIQDSNPARFFTYLSSSISPDRSLAEDYFSHKLDIQNSTQIQSITEYPLQELSSLNPFRIIVLDDYHCISDPKIHEAMSYLLQNLPVAGDEYADSQTGCHFVIITRNDPPFPISRWRLRDEITEIRSADLRFSPDEIEQICNQIFHLKLSASDLHLLEERTEGWVAGLQLAGISLIGLQGEDVTTSIQQIKGNNKIISDYLIEEVLSQLDPETQTFLLQTSILERLNGELCDAVTLSTGGQSKLESLEKRNIFVVPMDNERNWYRYHQLFSDVLLHRLKGDPIYLVDELHRRAAYWFEKHGLIEDCLKHWMEIGEYDQAARVVSTAAPVILSHGQFYILKNLIESFPADAFSIFPWISIYRAWANYIMDIESVESWLVLAEQVLGNESVHKIHTQKEMNEMLGNIAAIRALCAARKGDPEAILLNAPKALDYLPIEIRRVRGLVLNATATGQYINLHLEEAIQTFLKSKEILVQGGNLGGAAEVITKVGEIQIIQGRLNQAEKTLAQSFALEGTIQGKKLSITCLSYSNLGKIYYEWNRIDEALDLLILGCEESKKMGLSEKVNCAVAYANVKLGLGEIDTAETLLSEYIHQIGSGNLATWNEKNLVSSWMELLAVQGRSNEYNRFIRSQDIKVCFPGDSIHEPVLISYAKSAYYLGEYQECIDIAGTLEKEMENGKRTGRQIQILALLVAAQMRIGDTTTALASLSKSIQLSAREGFIRTYLGYGDTLLDAFGLLIKSERINQDSLDENYITDVMHCFMGAPYIKSIQPVARSGMIKGIPRSNLQINIFTEHEEKVLRLLLAGQSNRQMASELCVSINTVKKHINNIYAKLDVHSRFQASIRVKQLGIFLK